MAEEKKYSIPEADHYFGVMFNNAIFSLLKKNEKSDAAHDEIINLAHGALLHWSRDPKRTKANLARGENMVAFAYINAGRKNEAIYHAEKNMRLVKDFESEMEDFDLAYAAMAMAGSQNLAGQKLETEKYLKEAKERGENLKNIEDKKIYMSDLKTFIDKGYRL